MFECGSFVAGERTLHSAGAAVRPRPHGRAAAVQQPQQRLHHLPAAQAGRRHRQRGAAGTPPGRPLRPSALVKTTLHSANILENRLFFKFHAVKMATGLLFLGRVNRI